MKRYLLLVSLLVANVATAAGDGGHGGSIKDLLWPAFNFIVLVGFLVWKTKDPLKKSFVENSDSVKDLYNHAEEKDKEAQIKYEMYKDKVNSIESHAQKVEEETRKDIKKYESQASQETQEQIEKLKREANDKLEHEKKVMLEEINGRLLDMVVSKTKDMVASDNEAKNKATSKLLNQLQ